MKPVVLIAGAICITLMSILAEPAVGQNSPLKFTDVDGNALSTADGRVNVVVLTSKANIDKAHTVGDRIPDFCLANPTYRMITVVAFEKDHSRPVRAIMSAAIRHRLDGEAHNLQSRYDKLKITRDARHDVFAVADFDRAITTQLGAKWEANLFCVFVFGKNGELLKQWNAVPGAEDLAAALK